MKTSRDDLIRTEGVFLHNSIRWDSTISYVINDIVRWNGHLYVASVSNKNREPSAGSSYWTDYLASILSRLHNLDGL